MEPRTDDHTYEIAPSRRTVLLSTTFFTLAPALFTPPPVRAQEGESSPATAPRYSDPQDGFSIEIPSGWSQGSGNLGSMDPSDPRSRFSNAAGLQRVVAWLPPGTPDVSLAITVRTPGADFTSLGSYGTAQDFGERIIAQTDQSYLLRGPAWARKQGGEAPTVARLVSAEEIDGKYIIEYTVGKEGMPTRFVVTAVALGTSPTGLRRFFTVNGSCTETEMAGYGTALRDAVTSFTPPAF